MSKVDKYGEARENFGRLLEIMDELRIKCPWDRKQTIESLRLLTLEEVYELGDAILENDWENLMEEVGDVMLHLVFYAKIAEEQGAFDISKSLVSINEKLVRRHPHIFPSLDGSLLDVANEEEVSRNWERIKLQEGKKSVLGGVPKGLPAMVKAYRIQEKAKKVGFEWDNLDDVWKKVEEELNEFHAAGKAGEPVHIEEEFGDLLFSLINFARMSGIDPEAALEKTNRKFSKRFTEMETLATGKGKALEEMSLAEMDALWTRIKNNQNS